MVVRTRVRYTNRVILGSATMFSADMLAFVYSRASALCVRVDMVGRGTCANSDFDLGAAVAANLDGDMCGSLLAGSAVTTAVLGTDDVATVFFRLRSQLHHFLSLSRFVERVIYINLLYKLCQIKITSEEAIFRLKRRLVDDFDAH